MQGDHQVMQEMMQRMRGSGQHEKMDSGQPTMPGQGAFKKSSASSKQTQIRIGQR